MKWQLAGVTGALVSLVLSASAAFGQDLPPGPVTISESRFDASQRPAQFELIQLILDFPPGAWTPAHSHGGPAYVTVLQGEMTYREQDRERMVRAGESWTEPPGTIGAAGNSGSQTARIMVTFLLPPDTPLTSIAR